MDSHRIENLNLSYKMCSRELEAAKKNVEFYTKKVNSIVSFIHKELSKPHDTQLYLLAYDKALSDLMFISDFMRKFNIKCELTSMNLYDDYELSTIMQQQLKQIDNIEKEQFTYIKPDRSIINDQYKIGCLITHIKNKTEKLFYININDNPEYKDCVKRLHKYKETSLQLLDHFPEEGELFGLIIENYIFRAVRENDHYRKNKPMNLFNAYLIDTGEIFEVTEDTQLYYLPQESKKLPSQAILCKLVMVNYKDNTNLEEYLDNHIFMKDIFTVLKKEDSILYVNLVGDTNSSPNYLSEAENVTTDNIETSNGFIHNNNNQMNSNSSSSNNNENNLIDLSDTNNSTNFYHNVSENLSPINQYHLFLLNNNNYHNYTSTDNYDKFSNSSRNDSPPTCITPLPSSSSLLLNKIEKNSNENITTSKQIINDFNGELELSERELAMLKEEPLNTTNALKAVLGYIPKDDERICRFYDSTTKSCFKGSRCKLEHVEKLKDGWTRDEAEIVIDIKNKIFLPPVGNIITILPTCLINIQLFYAQYSTKSVQSQSPIRELLLKMNSSRIKSQYILFNCPPVPLQLVIAMYKDNMWYRAKIVEILDDTTYKVFYVDFGDTDIINIEKIRKWETKFDYLPFQAIKCQIAGIEAKKENHLRTAGMEQLKRMILNRALEAKVINIIDENTLLIQLYDEDGYNIGEQLISMEYANEKQIKFLNSKTLLPG